MLSYGCKDRRPFQSNNIMDLEPQIICTEGLKSLGNTQRKCVPSSCLKRRQICLFPSISTLASAQEKSLHKISSARKILVSLITASFVECPPRQTVGSETKKWSINGPPQQRKIVHNSTSYFHETLRRRIHSSVISPSLLIPVHPFYEDRFSEFSLKFS